MEEKKREQNEEGAVDIAHTGDLSQREKRILGKGPLQSREWCRGKKKNLSSFVGVRKRSLAMSQQGPHPSSSKNIKIKHLVERLPC